MRFATCVAADFRTIYFGTTNGIGRYDFYGNSWNTPYTRSDGLESDRIRLLGYDFNSAYLWAVTEAGLSFLVPGTGQWQNLAFSQTGMGNVTSIGFGKEYAWIESSGNLSKGNRFGGPFFSSRKNEADQDEVRWTGSLVQKTGPLPNFFMDNGYLFLPAGIIQDNRLRQFKIADMLQDRFDKLWISVWGLGAAVADMKTFQVRLLPFGLYTPEVEAMARDRNGIWIGGVRSRNVEEGGITFWEAGTDRWTYFESRYLTPLRSDDVTSIAVDGNRIWFGTEDGLACFNPENQTWKILDVFSNLWNNRVNNLSLGDSVLWVATESGINRVQLPSLIVDRIQDPRLSQRVIFDIAADGKDAWAGTDRGIYFYENGKSRWDAVGGWPGTISHTVTAVAVHPEEVWFGTSDGVEVYYKKENRWEGFPAFHYPTGGRIHAIAVDDSSAWLGTEDGVLKYKKSEKRWRRFSTEDGLLHNSVRRILLDGDCVWFGTAGGLTRFYWNAPYRMD